VLQAAARGYEELRDVVSAATPPEQPQACQHASHDALRQVVEAFSSASEELARRLGSEFIGIVLFGS